MTLMELLIITAYFPFVMASMQISDWTLLSSILIITLLISGSITWIVKRLLFTLFIKSLQRAAQKQQGNMQIEG